MFNLLEPYSGHFFDAEYLEYDIKTKTYKVGRTIKIKGNSSIGVSTGVREKIMIQDQNGRMVEKYTFVVSAVEHLPYKTRDKIRFIQDDISYIVFRVSDDITHSHSMANLMFPNLDNRPKVLYLGEK